MHRGKGGLQINRDWVEVEAGDFMWLRAFCPQACYAGGPGRFRYLLYKDVNRHAKLGRFGALHAASTLRGDTHEPDDHCHSPDREAFAPFGQVIEPDEARAFPINAGKCMRYHDLARAVTTVPGDPVYLSIARGQPYDMPLSVPLVERHPLGSQSFVPLTPEPFLVVVCPDEGGRPGEPVAFLTAPGQGVNYPPGLWHGVLTPLRREQDFLIVDRAGPTTSKNSLRYAMDHRVAGQRPWLTQR